MDRFIAMYRQGCRKSNFNFCDHRFNRQKYQSNTGDALSAQPPARNRLLRLRRFLFVQIPLGLRQRPDQHTKSDESQRPDEIHRKTKAMMARYDGYMLRQLIAMWGFFTLVLVGVFWISRSIGLFSTLLAGGHSPWVFFELTAFTLPTLVRTVMPMAVFAAVVFVTNRLRRESELVVLQAIGASPLRLARPVLYFALLTSVMIGAITLYLRPEAIAAYEHREAQLEQDVAAKLLREGAFLHPMEGVVMYLGEVNADTTLRDVYVSDRRDPKQTVTYTASEAYLVPQDKDLYVVMVDGMAARHVRKTDALSVTWFKDFTFEISTFNTFEAQTTRGIRSLPTEQLLFAQEQLQAERGFSAGKLAEELQERLSWIGICATVAMIGFTALLMGAHSRFGLWAQIGMAFVALIALEGGRGAAGNAVSQDASLWWVFHVPTGIGFVLSLVFLHFAGRPLRRPRAAA